MIIEITGGEHNFRRPAFDVKVLVEQLTLNIDSKQFSDLLDFGKFQNYSQLYGICFIYSFIYLFNFFK
jgi:hypothetical protein